MVKINNLEERVASVHRVDGMLLANIFVDQHDYSVATNSISDKNMHVHGI